ncbi:MAG: hypothetical protein EKK40_12285 [Bradyrhizobiaceae bacterium]|nr:MAG: hypothetical protein EKK40_12285 [Bradyrhizobiaceae bacterium]
MTYRSDFFRLRAIAAEQWAHEATDPAVRSEWEQIAIEWHAMASRDVQLRSRERLVQAAYA